MKVKAVIFDLDNTIYPVAPFGERMFSSLFRLIEENGGYTGTMEEIRTEVMKTPYPKVASMFRFSDALKAECLRLLENLPVDFTLEPFEDYPKARNLPSRKFLVTSGFKTLQYNKIKSLGIENDFEEIHIADHTTPRSSKKEVFADIMSRHGFESYELVVVGDDPNSEIQAANDLGIMAVLYDRMNFNPGRTDLNRIEDFGKLNGYLV
jgi:putative hydrolase of the HAD superfamily